ncbi:MAG: hypothetical protein ACE5IP_05490 [Terriglobia bacterium]
MFLSALGLMGAWLLAREQPEDGQACRFTLSAEPTQPVISGPQDIASRVRVLAQPESPVEITAIDFEGTLLSVHRGTIWKEFCHRAKLRNRSDRLVKDAHVDIAIVFVPRGMKGGSSVSLSRRVPQGLAPGQEVEVVNCGGGGGSGSAPHDNFRLLVAVDWVDFAGCRYYPPLHIPHRLHTGMSTPRAH